MVHAHPPHAKLVSSRLVVLVSRATKLQLKEATVLRATRRAPVRLFAAMTASSRKMASAPSAALNVLRTSMNAFNVRPTLTVIAPTAQRRMAFALSATLMVPVRLAPSTAAADSTRVELSAKSALVCPLQEVDALPAMLTEPVVPYSARLDITRLLEAANYVVLWWLPAALARLAKLMAAALPSFAMQATSKVGRRALLVGLNAKPLSFRVRHAPPPKTVFAPAVRRCM
mmetsp:Transcript_43142/g.77587  ORF Transcript_43142/g.77587 Transcript_43142/m.77587 type:complete len:229 (-) Transcript_43142:2562-3248(-)